MSQSNNSNNTPSLMLIMRSVAQAAGLTTADLIEGGRRAGLCHARAAVYKLASQHGYGKDEIMYFLDRNRTVAYNYEANLSGYLIRSKAFNTLCDTAKKILHEHPHRVKKNMQTTEPIESAAPAPAPKIKEPEFKDWKGQLGWTFTAEECRREWYAKRAAREFMKTYGQPHKVIPMTGRTTRRIADEMPTMDAAIYIGVSPGVLVKGVELGMLERFKKPNDNSYWYYTDQLNEYKQYITQSKQ